MKLTENVIGETLVLRNYNAADLAFCTSLWFDPENGKYLSDPTAEFVDEVYQKALDTMEDADSGYYLIAERKDTGESIGTCCAFPDEAGKSYDIGYCVRKDCWEQGYGSEIVKLLIGWLKEQGAESITAEVAIENLSSRRLLEKCGFDLWKESAFQKYGMGIEYESYIYLKKLKL